jgi:hypothetical protein
MHLSISEPARVGAHSELIQDEMDHRVNECKKLEM